LEFEEKYKYFWFKMMRNKLGLENDLDSDEKLILELLSWMHQNKADYTNTFCFLMNNLNHNKKIYENKNFQLWKNKWENRKKSNRDKNISTKLMKDANPIIIPRNHLVENVLSEVINKNNYDKFHNLLMAINDPLKYKSSLSEYQFVPDFDENNYVTYCGT